MSCEPGAISAVTCSCSLSISQPRARAGRRTFRGGTSFPVPVPDVQPGVECVRQCPAVRQRGTGGRAEVGGDKNVVQCDRRASRSVPIFGFAFVSITFSARSFAAFPNVS